MLKVEAEMFKIDANLLILASALSIIRLDVILGPALQFGKSPCILKINYYACLQFFFHYT